jgi:hypothetical protein
LCVVFCCWGICIGSVCMFTFLCLSDGKPVFFFLKTNQTNLSCSVKIQFVNIVTHHAWIESKIGSIKFDFQVTKAIFFVVLRVRNQKENSSLRCDRLYWNWNTKLERNCYVFFCWEKNKRAPAFFCLFLNKKKLDSIENF